MLTISIIHIIISIAFAYVKNISTVYSRTSQLILIYSIYLIYKVFIYGSLSNSVSLYNGLINANLYNQTFNLFVLIVTFLILTLTSFYPLNIKSKMKNLLSGSLILDKLGNHYKIPEYSLLLLFVVTGAVFLMLNSDLILLFLAIELQSYGLYLISTIFKDSENSTKAGLTYFLLGGFSSCIILLGLALLYVNFGSTSLESIYIIHDLFNVSVNEYLFYLNSNYYLYIILVILTVGLLFKISAAPFHFWSPDVYDNIPTVVTTFVAVVGKISILILLLQLCLSFSNSYMNTSWINNILISSSLSLIVGTVLGLTQSRIKRLFAYSTISHVGFILLGLSINTTESIQAFIFYIIQYSITNLNAFMLLIIIGYYLYNYTDPNEKQNNLKEKNNSPIQLISQLKGLSELNPLLSLSLAMTILSFLGIPPLAGFFGKLMILSASLDSGYVFMSLIIVITSVIGGVYYLMIIKEIYFNKPDYVFNGLTKSIFNEKNKTIIELSSSFTIIVSIITILITVYILIPDVPLNTLNILTVHTDFTNKV